VSSTGKPKIEVTGSKVKTTAASTLKTKQGPVSENDPDED